MLFGLWRTNDEVRLFGAARSSKWPTVRRRHLIAHPSCIVCGTTNSLEVHHRLPVHLCPWLELDPTNLVTLCDGPRSCHLNFGHYGAWNRWNPDVEQMAAQYLNGLKAAIERNANGK